MATEKSTSTPAAGYSESDMFLAGRNMAVLVLEQLRSEGDARCSIEAVYRDGLQQCDAMARAIEGLRRAPQEVISGFAAVLTEVTGCTSLPPDPDYFSGLTMQDMSPSFEPRSAMN